MDLNFFDDVDDFGLQGMDLPVMDLLDDVVCDQQWLFVPLETGLRATVEPAQSNTQTQGGPLVSLPLEVLSKVYVFFVFVL